MKCSYCSNKAVLNNRCKQHFMQYFENKVLNTIKRYRLFTKKHNVAVAVSGGKDSMALLHILNKNNYNVTAVSIDEGISGYREDTLKVVEEYCKKNQISFRVYTYKSEFRTTLDEMAPDRPCTVCGIWRRDLINKYTKCFDCVATGHNLDDEAQAVLMNLLKNNTTLISKKGPVTGESITKGFTKRVKPLFLCREKEVMVYSFINGLVNDFNECPNIRYSFRHNVRNLLNESLQDYPMAKENIIKWLLTQQIKYTKPAKTCSICKNPSSGDVCRACMIKNDVRHS